MIIIVNGTTEEVAARTVSDYVCERKLNSGSLVVEHNGQIIGSDKWEHALLREGDQLELLSFVGGG